MRFPISKEHQSSSSDSLILFLIYVVNALFLVLVVFLPSGFSKLNNHTLKPLYLLLQESTIETGICYLRLKSTKIIFVIHEAKSIIKVRIKISNVLRQTKLGLKRATSWILFKIKVQDTANPIIVANKGYTSNKRMAILKKEFH